MTPGRILMRILKKSAMAVREACLPGGFRLGRRRRARPEPNSKKGRKPKLSAFRILAEGEGFEPSIRNFRMPPFQGGTFNHSATLPRWSELTVSSESAIVQYIFKVV